MRPIASVFAFATALSLLVGCSEGPPFKDITDVKVRHIGKKGLTETVLDGREMKAFVGCLYTTQPLADETQAEVELLQTTYLIEVKDGSGDRSFELYTSRNLKGNRGRYYRNDCIHNLVLNAG